ncbi:ABC transporter ATP-binding protein [Arthrobacter sp. TMN-50]
MAGAIDPIIDVRGLGKDFGKTRALDGLDLTVNSGEVHGFLGPNGAGKSTTLRVLLGLIRPTFGTATVFGVDPWREPIRSHRDLAYVPGDVSLWPNLSGGEVIDLLTGLRGGAVDSTRSRLIDEFDFDPSRKARTYSKGNRQKVALIAAFARPARLYVLDEPSSGLDPIMESVFRQEVRRVHDDGATVLLSSHILSEVEQLCDRVTIIRSGKVVESGSLAELRHLKLTHFRVEGVDAGILSHLQGVRDVHDDGLAIEFEVEAENLPAALEGVAAARPTGLTVSPPSLESLFLRHYAEPSPTTSGAPSNWIGPAD